MAYDLHGNWDKVTGHHTAMVGDDKLTVEFATKYWIQRGKIYIFNKRLLCYVTNQRKYIAVNCKYQGNC